MSVDGAAAHQLLRHYINHRENWNSGREALYPRIASLSGNSERQSFVRCAVCRRIKRYVMFVRDLSYVTAMTSSLKSRLR
ncbi:hypothetical protein EVAR_87309_1 [Eumeta japonica]|uniref:Uncharacterized protein n=1 Tax=Eumeta variegata TaxID=151549 RepID=A0A4C1VXG2_EUMVA|nr:hypothetical protein EVAR_87309_1 [Eumeta japonica]